ncbi:MAG: hypothetical protein JRI41_07775 [Deltaproteobacteria bacterium]|nr:hypothetical protein [Deltaproteobacteria bacterium]
MMIKNGKRFPFQVLTDSVRGRIVRGAGAEMASYWRGALGPMEKTEAFFDWRGVFFS